MMISICMKNDTDKVEIYNENNGNDNDNIHNDNVGMDNEKDGINNDSN